MPLANYGSPMSGFAQGVSEGLRNLAVIQHMKTMGEQSERAKEEEAWKKTTRGWETEEHTRQTTETPLDKYADTLGGGALTKQIIIDTARGLGVITPKNTIMPSGMAKVYQALKADQWAQHSILLDKKDKLSKEITDLTSSLSDEDLAKGVSPSLKTINQKQEERDNLNYADTQWVAKQNMILKERGVVADETKAKAADFAARYGHLTSSAALRGRAALETDLEIRDRLISSAKDIEAADLKKHQLEYDAALVRAKQQADLWDRRQTENDQKYDARLKEIELKHELETLDKTHVEILKDFDNKIKEEPDEKEKDYVRAQRQSQITSYKNHRNNLVRGTQTPVTTIGTVQGSTGSNAPPKRITYNPSTGKLE